MTTWNDPVDIFIAQMRELNLRRALIATDPRSGDVHASHPAFDGLRDALRTNPNYARHSACFFEIGSHSGHLLSAFIHRTERGQAAGGVRFWAYPAIGNLIEDGLRLSVGMGQKTALAGLWWGGGKGIIARQGGMNYDDARTRGAVFRDYGQFISGLSGCYITAEDVGTRPLDMAAIFSMTRHTTCIPPALGGSGNPGVLTARGVVVAMEAVLEHLGKGDLSGKTIAMQGIGNVAVHMVAELLDRGVAHIFASDIDADAVRAARTAFAESKAKVEIVQCERDDWSVLTRECDILAPNAVGGILNPDTIAGIRAPIVCGAANNQLAELERDALALQDRGIVYVPDFLANRMGIVNCANEQYGVFAGDPAIAAHLDRDNPDGVFQRLSSVLSRADESGRPPAIEAALLADELAGELHPVWGNRGQAIIEHLISGGWADAP